MNVVDTVALAGTLVLALPIGMLGVEFLVTGRPLVGTAFVGVAAALVLGQHYLETSPVERVASGVVDRLVSGGGETTGDAGAGDDGEAPRR